MHICLLALKRCWVSDTHSYACLTLLMHFQTPRAGGGVGAWSMPSLGKLSVSLENRTKEEVCSASLLSPSSSPPFCPSALSSSSPPPLLLRHFLLLLILVYISGLFSQMSVGTHQDILCVCSLWTECYFVCMCVSREDCTQLTYLNRCVYNQTILQLQVAKWLEDSKLPHLKPAFLKAEVSILT